MPARTINPFATNTSTPSLDAMNEKRDQPRRTSFKGNKLTSLFGGSPKARNDWQAAIVAQQQALLNSPSPQQINSSTLSLPTINLTTATGEKMPSEPKTLFQPPSPEEARRLARAHAQFGPLGSQSHRYTSKFEGGEFAEPVEDEPPYYFLFTTYISYLILIVFGHVRDFFGKRFRRAHYSHLKERGGYAPLNSDFDNFYTRRLKMRINDCFSRPTTGVPGRFITLLDRKSDDGNNTFKLLGTTTETLNMSSYNYLGFAQSEGPCADATENTIKKYGITMASPRSDAGTSDLTLEVEDLIAKFVGKPASMVFSMGFVTNATSFPTLVGKGCLMISDELNHSSIRFGARLSGAVVTMFKHNDMKDLERVLREQISQGQPRTHRPWKKILVAVEGLYSMEGTMCNLPALVQMKKKYKYHLFVDEAHSIGALGPQGRGVCDYFGIDPAEVDILMGTLTKSFGANGGYIAAEKSIIDKLRTQNAAMLFAESPSPPVLTQIASSLRIIAGDLVPGQGEERLQRLAFNSRYLRLGLKRLGFIVYGHDDSPIIPVMLYNPAKMPAFSHEMLRRKISVVVVGYPATPLVSSRARFCVSAAHTKEDLDRMLAACDEIGDLLQLKFSSGVAGGAEPEEWIREEKAEMKVRQPRWRLEDVLKRGTEDVKVPLR
ncbi:serine palmitoyltransferas-like protein 2 [Lindgomyces ingoldianus]|uniref:Serine palmitoyltransferas-like protein 2 n=1 Tax=Lindgomyces ingoldianus TaxID=673940 RepID=A0ACB6QIV9_9PLEO|nr:serine palmitoyltransferas-like protein 2 [Lindgomyces ingoldianus]KAF2466057.1 serine palmitoyltransferas-like protein 2 [Lindgomyces ingoldianus]